MEQTKRNIILGIFIFSALVLTLKAAQIQLLDSSFKDKARRTTLNEKKLYPTRGLIYDRNMKLLAANEPNYELKLVYNQLDPKMDTMLFCELLDIDKETFEILINKNWRDPRFSKSTPFRVKNNISPEKYAVLQEHMFRFPGFFTEMRNVRSYPHTSSAHVLGYLGEVNQSQINNSEGVYELGDFKGLVGLEEMYEEELRGKKGVEYMLRDNLGRNVEVFDGGNLNEYPVPGDYLITGLDLELQKFGEALMANKRGSIVAIDPSTGEILTALSSISYDPNQMSISSNRDSIYRAMNTDSLNRPLFDRSVQAKYPPGSILKPVMALIALQEGLTTVNRSIPCDGSYRVARNFYQKCHAHNKAWGVAGAIQYSCNSYFYQIMREMVEKYGYTNPGKGLDMVMDHLKEFGLGDKLDVDISSENKGNLPSSEYFNKLYNKNGATWRSTAILSIGIGQGELELTTVQMANLAAIIANRGYYYKPHLVKSFSSQTRDIPDKYKVKNEVNINKEFYGPVIDGMEMAIEAGTAPLAKIPGIQVCGKTGTSQNIGKDHSVFFAFAPKENPKIAIAVFIENGGWGGSHAAPIASLMIEQYLNKKIAENRNWILERELNANLLEDDKT
ncbi:penicillin-binding protein 2 [Portibacter lacus]|uniref:Penicillin-binding protein 2 n=1 Tax=Portibacter lacus TaxID=1099794 RepID=A0AA37SN96_9BACT|nr:penicillin-binding protein 2 [Portibacter lacus]GLR16594.1 penicillin-binding protein 2 [Portibacter lacus]